MGGDMRLVQGCCVNDGINLFQAVLDKGALRDGADKIRVRGGNDIDACNRSVRILQRTNNGLTEVPCAACHQNFHGVI